ncbi:phage holin family protein [Amycolatopsis rubida]|uniref:Putative Holin-X, holin superfamily III n=1 Tax=Amycolatopsis rubida TaxID=112413 RepID=A0A1I6AQR2_9PSEU|nr:phage holin family protein [Amycolatopsis rubida]SFQ71005.1 Putative Holin-X, holin superfamily III [Amycolatopsis rubida]
MLEEMNRTPAHEKSAADLAADLSASLKRLLHDELRLAMAELQAKGKRFGIGAGLVGFAGVLAFLGGATLIAAAVLALALVVPGWLSALLVGGALLLVAGLAALAGGKEASRAGPVVPEESVERVREDVETMKQVRS